MLSQFLSVLKVRTEQVLPSGVHVGISVVIELTLEHLRERTEVSVTQAFLHWST